MELPKCGIRIGSDDSDLPTPICPFISELNI